MSIVDYGQKYLINKIKYISIRNEILDSESKHQVGGYTIPTDSEKSLDSIDDEYYVVHSSHNADNLLETLKDGYIRPGSMVDKSRRIFSGGEPLDYVYANIQFTDIKNLDRIGAVTLILRPKIIKEYGVIFNQGWFKYPTDMSIYVRKDDSNEEKNRKIMEIKNYVSNPTFYKNSPIASSFTGIMAHELLFNVSIPLKDNLIGIICFDCPKKYLRKIKTIMKRKYPMSKIF